MKPILQSSLYREVVRVLTSADTKTASPDRSNPNRSPTFSRFELPAGVNPRVLLAEDNPLNQKVAKLQLAKIGLVVDVAGNGREAVETALRLHYDIIFMDCQMPELDGYEATRELRRRAPSEHSKIIAMTAHALPGDREKCLAAGMDAYISKPVTQDSLEAVLEELFPAHSSPQATDREAVISSGSPTTLPEISPTYRQSLATPLAEDALRPQPLPPPGAAQPSSPVHVEPEGAAIEISPIAGVGSSNGLAAKAEALSGQAAKDLGHVCDRATLEELRAEGDNLLPELIEMFQTELTKGLNELTHALATRDCSAVARIAHTLKGTAGTFGAMQMHEMAGRMDQAARAGEAEQAATMFEEFRLECERVRRYLAAEIKTSMVLAVDAENSEVSDR